MKILLLDIETGPLLSYVWGVYDQNVNLDGIVSHGEIMSWAAKWLGEKTVRRATNPERTARSTHKMLKEMHELLDEADVVVHYNGTRFDIPELNKYFILNGFTPPSPYREIDLYRVVKSRFRFACNKLDYVAQRMGLGEKTKHEGFTLWLKCLNNVKTAWKEMEKYNVQDVVLLERLYEKLKPWIRNHPAVTLTSDLASMLCPICNSPHLLKRGFGITAGNQYQRYQCKGCGGWTRDNKGMINTRQRKNLLKCL